MSTTEKKVAKRRSKKESVAIAPSDTVDVTEQKTQTKKAKKEKEPNRKPNPWVQFIPEEFKRIKAEHPEYGNEKIMPLVGESWRQKKEASKKEVQQ